MASLHIPYDYLNKIFISHLHTDHFGDFAAYFIGGWVAGRQGPLHVHGPSGDRPELGTKYAIEHWRKALTWDLDGRAGITDPRGYKPFDVTEFDYKGVNQVIYQENGVTIRSIPAIHTADGAVSFILEWNGLKFCYSSDTFPNKWWIEHTKGADLSVHECFADPQILLDKQKYPPDFALSLSVFKHTSPQQFGKVMSQIEPRMAVAYHTFNDFNTAPDIIDGIRQHHGTGLIAFFYHRALQQHDFLFWKFSMDIIC